MVTQSVGKKLGAWLALGVVAAGIGVVTAQPAEAASYIYRRPRVRREIRTERRQWRRYYNTRLRPVHRYHYRHIYRSGVRGYYDRFGVFHRVW